MVRMQLRLIRFRLFTVMSIACLTNSNSVYAIAPSIDACARTHTLTHARQTHMRRREVKKKHTLVVHLINWMLVRQTEFQLSFDDCTTSSKKIILGNRIKLNLLRAISRILARI